MFPLSAPSWESTCPTKVFRSRAAWSGSKEDSRWIISRPRSDEDPRSANGRVGDPPDHTGTTLSIHAEGPNIALFDHLVGLELPAEPFTIEGRLGTGEQALTLDGVNARIGLIGLQVDGTLKTANGLSGSTLQIVGQGPDATIFRDLIGLDNLPPEAWSVDGGLAILDSALRLDGVSATVGSLETHGDGRLSTASGLVGSDLQIKVEDLDLSHAMSIFGVAGFPDVAAAVDGRLRVEPEGIGSTAPPVRQATSMWRRMA